uniref:Peptidase A1 domain-containing protein n=1 Tax=Caenorhabditis tropicalis TaxID=1561998 RepID=A0A1I7U5U1_9PELO
MIKQEIGIRNYPDSIILPNAVHSVAPDGDLSFGLRFIFDFQVPTYVVRDDGIIADLLIENRTLFFR